MSDASDKPKRPRALSVHQVFLRGLAISLPAILTIVILLWLLGGVSTYIIEPTTDLVKLAIAWTVDRSTDLRSDDLVKLENGPPLKYCGENYVVSQELKTRFQNVHNRRIQTLTEDNPGLADGAGSTDTPNLVTALDEYFSVADKDAEWLTNVAVQNDDPQIFVPLDRRAVPYVDYAIIARDTSPGGMPTTSTALYMEYAVRQYVGSAFTLSVFALSLVVVAIYFLGRFVSVRLGSWAVSQVENRLLGRLPVIRNVYGSAKQVTDFLFSENQVEYRRVVAIEYPRPGIWSLGLVTGEGMLDITTAVGEPCVSLLIPSSPMPVTGYTMCIPRSAVLDLDITVDQAFQFCISCGVLVPKNQKVTPEVLERELTKRLAERMRDSPLDRRPLSTLPPPKNTSGEDEEGSASS